MIIAILIVLAVLAVVVINSTLQQAGITDHMGDELRAYEGEEE